MHLVPKIIDSGQHVDERGKLIFFNELSLQGVKRLYIIEHPDPHTVRAWQAHKREQKWFFVIDAARLPQDVQGWIVLVNLPLRNVGAIRSTRKPRLRQRTFF